MKKTVKTNETELVWIGSTWFELDLCSPCKYASLATILVGFKGPVHRTGKRPDWDWTRPEKNGLLVAVQSLSLHEKKTDETEPV